MVLGVLLDREPFSTVAAHLFSKAEIGELSGYVCATTITTIYYLARKVIGAARAQEETRKLLVLFGIAPVNRVVLEEALASRITDFEDAVICQAALHVGAQGIVTRDIDDFKGAGIPLYSPEELAEVLGVRSG